MPTHISLAFHGTVDAIFTVSSHFI